MRVPSSPDARLPFFGAVLLLCALLPAATPLAGHAPDDVADRALVEVRTLIIDALGTRTVDTDTARVPFGSRGLLIKSVPYGGPPLSFRLAVLVGPPQVSGIPLTLSAEVWSGALAAEPGPDGLSRREEATMVAPESSYLLEIDHDEDTDRRIVLSVSARPSDGNEALVDSLPPAGPRPVRFLLEVVREVAGEDPVPDTHLLNTIVGRSVTFSSGVKVRLPSPGEDGAAGDSAGGMGTVGLTVSLTAEQSHGDLITVRVDLEGAEFVDQARRRIEPIKHSSVHTVSSGSRLEVSVRVPSDGPPPGPDGEPVAGGADRPVTYRIAVTPSVE